MTQHTEKFLQRRRFAMVLPILVTPFLALLFWALGGGQGTAVQAAEQPAGLNMELPGAHFGKNETSLWDKFSLYEQAKRDSIKYEEARRADPYYAIAPLVPSDSTPQNKGKLMTSLGKKDHRKAMEQQEAVISKKLEELTAYVNSPTAKPEEATTPPDQTSAVATNSGPDSEAIDRLEKMMAIMSSSNVEDTEMKQIDGMLDKILAIQNPTAVQGKQAKVTARNAGKVFSAEPAHDEQIETLETANDISQLGMADSLLAGTGITQTAYAQIGFYGLEDEYNESSNANTILAVVHETQNIVAGASVKMRLLTDVTINGTLVKANEFIYGICQIQGERLLIKVASIHTDSRLLPVALSAHDLDGMEGLHIPGAISRDVAKQTANQSVQDVNLFSTDTSLGAQAAAAGAEIAKGLFAKKAKLIVVTVKAGYQVLLLDRTQPAAM